MGTRGRYKTNLCIWPNATWLLCGKILLGGMRRHACAMALARVHKIEGWKTCAPIAWAAFVSYLAHRLFNEAFDIPLQGIGSLVYLENLVDGWTIGALEGAAL